MVIGLLTVGGIVTAQTQTNSSSDSIIAKIDRYIEQGIAYLGATQHKENNQGNWYRGEWPT